MGNYLRYRAFLEWKALLCGLSIPFPSAYFDLIGWDQAHTVISRENDTGVNQRSTTETSIITNSNESNSPWEFPKTSLILSCNISQVTLDHSYQNRKFWSYRISNQSKIQSTDISDATTTGSVGLGVSGGRWWHNGFLTLFLTQTAYVQDILARSRIKADINLAKAIKPSIFDSGVSSWITEVVGNACALLSAVCGQYLRSWCWLKSNYKFNEENVAAHNCFRCFSHKVS